MKKETPNCAKCFWFCNFREKDFCFANRWEFVENVYGTPICKKLYEPKDEVAK